MKISYNLKDFREKSKILSEIEIKNPKTGEKKIVKALWDTGATFTCVSEQLSKEMNFTQDGFYTLQTPSLIVQTPRWNIELKIDPNKTAHYTFKAGTFENNIDFDVIIGFDLLLMGKLTMWTEGGKFNFEFIENIYKD